MKEDLFGETEKVALVDVKPQQYVSAFVQKDTWSAVDVGELSRRDALNRVEAYLEGTTTSLDDAIAMLEAQEARLVDDGLSKTLPETDDGLNPVGHGMGAFSEFGVKYPLQQAAHATEMAGLEVATTVDATVAPPLESMQRSISEAAASMSEAASEAAANVSDFASQLFEPVTTALQPVTTALKPATDSATAAMGVAVEKTQRFFGITDTHESALQQLPPTLPHLVKAVTPATCNNNFDARSFAEKEPTAVKYVQKAMPTGRS